MSFLKEFPGRIALAVAPGYEDRAMVHLRALDRHHRAYFTAAAAPIASSLGLGLSAPATLGLSLVPLGVQLLTHYIGQGRSAANAWTQGQNGQDAFLKNVLEPASKLDPQQASQMVDTAWRQYLQGANAYASQGSNQLKVIQQNLTTPAFMNTVASLLGKDPLGAEYTQPFLGQAGNTLGSAGSTIVSGLGKILPAIGKIGGTPSGGGTPPFMPSNGQQGGTGMGSTSNSNWLQLALQGGLAALGGGLLNTAGARTSTSTSTMTPGENPQVAGIGSMLRNIYAAKLGAPTPLAGYSANGLQNINDTFAGIKQNSDNNLTSRGLATSPVAATVDTNLDAARGGQMATFLNNLPLLQRQMQNEDLGSATNFYDAQPRPVTSSGTNVNPGSAVGAALASGSMTMMKLLGILHGQGSFGPGSPVPQGSIYSGGGMGTPPFVNSGSFALGLG